MVTLPGDYNNNGKVDAADYTKWRNNLGAAIALPNEGITPGMVTTEDYDLWKTNFGMMAGSGSIADQSARANGAVPEPTGLVLLIAALSPLVARRPRGQPPIEATAV